LTPTGGPEDEETERKMQVEYGGSWEREMEL
jgi:hypothetical protein